MLLHDHHAGRTTAIAPPLLWGWKKKMMKETESPQPVRNGTVFRRTGFVGGTAAIARSVNKQQHSTTSG